MIPSFTEDDSKDGRYFPNELETPILVQNLQLYFSHPERSTARSQVVTNVVSKLSTTNPHWNQRTVRLWFNNNKRVYFHPPEPPKDSFKIPPAKPTQPPRPQSVPYIAGFNLKPIQSPPIQPRQESFAYLVRHEFPSQMNHQENTLHFQRHLENQILTRIAQIHLQLFDECSRYQGTTTSIMDSGGSTLKMTSNQIFEFIDCGTFYDKFLLVCYNDELNQELRYGDLCIKTHLHTQVSSINLLQDMIWMHTDSVLLGYDQQLNLKNELKINPKRGSKSAINLWNGSIVLASGSALMIWNQERIESNEKTFSTCLTSYLNSIQSLSVVSDSLIVGSPEHHTPHVFATNGTIIGRPTGHFGGITALCSFGGNSFVSGSSDQIAKLWDIRTCLPTINFVKHGGFISCVSGDDDHYVLTGGSDAIVRVWDIRMARVTDFCDLAQSIPISVNFSVDGISVIVSESFYDTYYGLEKFGFCNHINKNPVHATLTFSR